MTRTDLIDYLESPKATDSREQLWDRIQFDDFDFDSLASVPLADLQFACARVAAHTLGDMYSLMATENENEDNTDA